MFQNSTTKKDRRLLKTLHDNDQDQLGRSISNDSLTSTPL